VEAEVGVESMDDLNGPGRHGSGEVRVTDVSWSVNGGEFGRLAMATGDEVVFRIDYEAKVAVANAVFGIGFINEAGVSVSGPNSGATRTWSLAPGAGSVTFTVPRLLLQPAELSLSVAVVDRGHFFDYLDRSYPMRVRSRGSSEPGLVQTLGQWDLHTYQGKVP
jgi:lipopolysaccharide transport system ATP-binding protein